jgi:hypothetical protein
MVSGGGVISFATSSIYDLNQPQFDLSSEKNGLAAAKSR